VVKIKNAGRRRAVKLLQRFVLDEIAKRHISVRQFAKECGVAASTMTGYANGDGHEPTLSSLRNIAKYTGVPLGFLIGLAYPDVAGELNISPRVAFMAHRLSMLSEDEFDLFERLAGTLQGDHLSQQDIKHG
jgi:transcriptional regulator with XRE-family HTH domain